MFDYRVEDFEILRFFSYTSTIPVKDRTLYYDGMNHSGNWHPNIREKFDIFEDALAEYATEIWKEHTGKDCYTRFMDNKSVFQLRHKYSGEIIFIGHYDMYRFVGKSCYLHDGNIFDFKTFKESDFVSNVICNELGLWKKFEF